MVEVVMEVKKITALPGLPLTQTFDTVFDILSGSIEVNISSG